MYHVVVLMIVIFTIIHLLQHVLLYLYFYKNIYVLYVHYTLVLASSTSTRVANIY